jgi:glycosyltransferase involved in cell wall biosynthesis
VAFLAGELGKGGAEKQLVYMCRALRLAGADVRVFVLAAGGYYDGVLRGEGVFPEWIGSSPGSLSRLRSLGKALRRFRPHVLQSAHFYANAYVAVLSRVLGVAGVGTIRNDTIHELGSNGLWGPIHLRLPRVLVANSRVARENAGARGADVEKIFVLPNVIDVAAFDVQANQDPLPAPAKTGVRSVMVCRLVAAKRVDRFLEALGEAIKSVPSLKGIVVGDGPERGALERRAQDRGLCPGSLDFLGSRDDIPAILRTSDFLVLSSDHEGFPNVLLEAMASRLPVVATPAGDSARVIVDGEHGFIVPLQDTSALASAMVRLATDRTLRRRMGEAGRRRVEQEYDSRVLPGKMLELYGAMGRRIFSHQVLRTIEEAAARVRPGGSAD